MDRNRWKTDVKSFDPAPWPCPTCGDGRLRQDGILQEQTRDSRRAHEDYPDDWEPEWVEERFQALLRCQDCNDIIFAIGVNAYEEDYYEREITWNPVFKPLYIYPAPHIVRLTEIPDKVSAELLKSFALYWSDPSASGNAIRRAVERMMDERRVPKTQATKKGRKRRTLHSRIKAFGGLANKNKTPSERLIAVKWLGNAGTHNELTHKDVLDALEIIESVLDSVYRPKRIESLVKAVLRKKGPTT